MTQITAGTNKSTAREMKTFFAFIALGLPGILSLIPVVIDQVEGLPPEFAELPQPALVALSLINPLILLFVTVAAGCLMAHRVGLRSLVAENVRYGTSIWPQLRQHIKLAFGLGIVLAFVITGLDKIINPFAATEMVVEPVTIMGLLSQLMLGVLYGGIVEELLMRWGIMSLLVWIGWRVFQKGKGQAHSVLLWIAITLAAVLFGLGHLPALANLVELTPLVVARTIFLNSLGGLVFGWLYWKRSLEVAMVAHAAVHAGFFLINAAAFLLNAA